MTTAGIQLRIPSGTPVLLVVSAGDGAVMRITRATAKRTLSLPRAARVYEPAMILEGVTMERSLRGTELGVQLSAATELSPLLADAAATLLGEDVAPNLCVLSAPHHWVLVDSREVLEG